MALDEVAGGQGLRFRQLVLAGLEDYGLDVPLRFADGTTWISLDEGIDDSTIAEGLKGRLGAQRVVTEGAAGASVPSWIGFVDRDVPWPYGARAWEPLAEVLASVHGLRLDHARLERDVGEGVTCMLARKFAGLSKFGGRVETGDAVTATIGTDGAIRMAHGPTGRSLDYGFQAAGERYILCFAVNRALRVQLGRVFDVPLVVDGILEDMDRDVLHGVAEVIGTIGAQQIVIGPAEVYETLEIEPGFDVKADRRTGQWRVVPRLRH